MEFSTSVYFLAALFFVVALAYSSVGLGGGSSYTALLAIMGFSTLAIPLVSLTLNVVVTSIGSYQFLKYRHGKARLIFPFILSSIPMAYLGGALQLPRFTFYMILLGSLIFVAARIYVWKTTRLKLALTSRQTLWVSLGAGSVLGLVAGISGIGGGVYLIPLIIILGLGTEKEAAACGAIFVWVNSVAGLASRLQFNSIDLTPFIPLIIAVIIGGWIGSNSGARKFSPQTMEKLLGLIILLAIILLGQKIFLRA